jgi:hypothetical protein
LRSFQDDIGKVFGEGVELSIRRSDTQRTRSVPECTTKVKHKGSLHVHVEEPRVVRNEPIEVRNRGRNATYISTLRGEKSTCRQRRSYLMVQAALVGGATQRVDDRGVRNRTVGMNLPSRGMTLHERSLDTRMDEGGQAVCSFVQCHTIAIEPGGAIKTNRM